MKFYLKKVWQRTKDAVTGNTEHTVTLQLDPEQLRDGLVAKLGTRDFSILLVIASYLSEDGQTAYPTLEQLGEATGLSRPTLINAVKSLQKKKAVTVAKAPAKNGQKSVYTILSSLDTDEPDKTARDWLNLFCSVFEETYGHAYMPNYGRDQHLIKTKLMATFKQEELPDIIKTAVTDYHKWSSNPQYPEPTVGALCSWLATKAATQIAEQKKQSDAVAKRIADAAKQAAQYNPLDLLEGGTAL